MSLPSAAAALLLLGVLFGLCAAVQWLALEESGLRAAWNETQHCRLLDGAGAERWSRLCRRHREAIPCALRAARHTASLCRAAFAHERWNCSDPNAARRGTRESAFLHALSAAAISHSIAQGCASGELPQCSCGDAPSEETEPHFRWGGCGDNLRFGLYLGTAFADGPVKSHRAGGRPAHRFVELHNNAVGRQVLTESLHTKCKCHGISGSCSVRTCWKSLHSLAETAQELKSKYLTATRVAFQRVGVRKKLIPKDTGSPPLDEAQLVYLLRSPDYCVKNPKVGSLGTENRHCNRTSVGSDNCGRLCCGRGYNVYAETVEERCHCRYYWCCYVRCRSCTRTVERSVCK